MSGRSLWQKLRGQPDDGDNSELASAFADEANLLRPTVDYRLAVIEEQLALLIQRTEDTATRPSPTSATLEDLVKQINRSGREQLKTNSLVEAQLEQLDAALELLRANDQRREAELAALRSQHETDKIAARLDVVQRLLPALDGIDEALRSGQQLLEQTQLPPVPPTIIQRMREHTPQPQREHAALRDALQAWLVGLTFVRQRLLDVLATEGVQPITALGQRFDPQQHVVVDVVPATSDAPPGTVTAEIRRGYVVHDKILRHAEVAVSRQENTVGAQ